MAHRRAASKGGVSPGAIRDTGRWKNGRVHYEDWTRMFKPNLHDIAVEAHLGKTDMRVLLLCASHATPDNRITLAQRDIGELLHINPSAVSKAVKTLVGLGFLLQTGHTLHLNSRVGTDAKDDRAILRLRRREVPQLQALDAQLEVIEEDAP